MAIAKAWRVGGGWGEELVGLSTWPPGLEQRDRAGRDRRVPISLDGPWKGLGGSFSGRFRFPGGTEQGVMCSDEIFQKAT